MATLVLLSISDLMEVMNLVPEEEVEAPNPDSFQLETPITRKRSASEKNGINNFCPACRCLSFILVAFFKTTLRLTRN